MRIDIFGYLAIVFMLTLSSHSFAEGTNLTIYPVPDGEKMSEEFSVWVNDNPLPVYNKEDVTEEACQQDKKRFGNGGGLYSFAYFDFEGTVEVRIKSRQRLRDAVIRPLSKKINFEVINDNEISFKLSSPANLSIEGERPKDGLLLFANPPCPVPRNKRDPRLVYYGPGIHRPGVIRLKSNQVLYIDGGAIVKAGIVVEGRNVIIAGRGIIDGSFCNWPNNPAKERGFINIVNSSGVKMSGVIVRASPCWTIVPMHSSNISFSNIKICNSRVENDDGIDPCNSQRIVVDNCFFRTDDDCMAFKGWAYPEKGSANSNVENITVKRSVFWCDRARIFLLGHESRAKYMRNITFQDNDIIHFAMPAFLLEPGEDMVLKDITCDNIRINGEEQHDLLRLRPLVIPEYMQNKVPGHVSNITFSNITLTGKPGAYQLQLFGADEKHLVNGVLFRNVVIYGNEIVQGSPYIKTNEHVKGIRF